jgi:hypothetical protein
VIVSDNLPLLFSPPQNTKPNQTKIMKNTLHTPGPWKHDPTWGIIKHGKSEICALHSGNLDNARLIASAPDLIDLLEAAIARIQLANEEGNPILSAWLPDALSTLRKAKGEA